MSEYLTQSPLPNEGSLVALFLQDAGDGDVRGVEHLTILSHSAVSSVPPSHLLVMNWPLQ